MKIITRKNKAQCLVFLNCVNIYKILAFFPVYPRINVDIFIYI